MLQRELQSREADERAREPSRDHEGGRAREMARAAELDTRLARVRGWKRALSAAERESAALRAELLEAQKKLRQSEVHKKAAEDAGRKLQRLSREHERSGQQLLELQLSAAGQATQKAQYESEAIGLSRENEALQGKLAALSSEAERLTQSQAKLEYERRKDALLVRMPRLAGIACSERPQKGRLKNASTPCTEILSAIERELGAAAARNPRLVQLLQKATREVRACTD